MVLMTAGTRPRTGNAAACVAVVKPRLAMVAAAATAEHRAMNLCADITPPVFMDIANGGNMPDKPPFSHLASAPAWCISSLADIQPLGGSGPVSRFATGRQASPAGVKPCRSLL